MDIDAHNRLSVYDVYNIAKDIAFDFEAVAEVCNSDVVQPVVLKVINALEHLESIVLKLEFVEKDLLEMKMENELLQSQKRASVQKMDMDMQEVESSWQKEIDRLRITISKLQGENKELQHLLKDCLRSQAQKDSNSEQCLIEQLQITVESLSFQLKEKNELLESHISCIISLKASLEKEKYLKSGLQNNVKESEELICKLWKEKADLQNEVTLQKDLVERLQSELKDTTERTTYYEQALSCCKNVELVLNEQAHSLQINAEDYIKKLVVDKDNFMSRISDLEEQLYLTRCEADDYKKKYLASYSRRRSTHGSRKIRQLFRFFLEFVTMDQTTLYF